MALLAVRPWRPLAWTLPLLALGWAAPAGRAAAAADEPIFMDVRLMAADLVDELVYSWTQEPPLSTRAALVLADVSAPVGLDERFNMMVENRLFELIRQNPAVQVDLAHCGPCTRFVAKSNPKSTILSRGIDQPETLAQLLTEMPARQALSLDFEAEGRSLVLRAQIFELTGAQRILWAQSYATSLSARVVLREATPLISLAAAREQQRQVLRGHDPLEVTTRLVIRSFNTVSSAPVAAAPLPFLEQSFEAVPLPRRDLRAGVTVGFTSIANSLSAWSAGGHLMWLLGRDAPSLTTPDLYSTFGFQYIRMRGPGVIPFEQNQPNLDQLRSLTSEPRASLVAYRLGLEAHIKFRLGMLFFVEYIPTLKGDDALEQRSFLGIPYHDMGGGMVVRW